MLKQVAASWAELSSIHPAGRLVSIAIGHSAEVEVYIRGQKRGAEKAGIAFEEQHWPEDINQSDSKARIMAMNDDSAVVGIILQRPVPAHINVRSLQSAIHPLKDVEGMNPASIGNIVYDDLALSPCTAAASVDLIKATGLDLNGLEVVIIGHSAIVGKPAAFLLMAEGATVTVCHHRTRSVASHSRRADAVLVAVGIPGFLTADMVKPGAAVIDIGINHVTAEDGSIKIVGDAATESVKDVASWITPVPGGVGPVTVARLMKNAQAAWQRQIELGWTN
jgi:methylenetetrahydrofolate dehydrogenase (NADP+)/methenyltetrahydrofolate cyclohydrolase